MLIVKISMWAFGFRVTEEMYKNHFLTDKNSYRNYKWSKEINRKLLERP